MSWLEIEEAIGQGYETVLIILGSIPDWYVDKIRKTLRSDLITVPIYFF